MKDLAVRRAVEELEGKQDAKLNEYTCAGSDRYCAMVERIRKNHEAGFAEVPEAGRPGQGHRAAGGEALHLLLERPRIGHEAEPAAEIWQLPGPWSPCPRAGRMLDGFWRHEPVRAAGLLILVHGMGGDFLSFRFKKTLDGAAARKPECDVLSFNNRGSGDGRADGAVCRLPGRPGCRRWRSAGGRATAGSCWPATAPAARRSPITRSAGRSGLSRP